MRTLVFLVLVLCGTAVSAQNPDPAFNGCSQLVKTWRKAMNDKNLPQALSLCRTAKTKDLFTESFNTVTSTFGTCLDAVLTDSSYQEQTKDPKAFVTLQYISYYDNAMLEEKFVLAKDKKTLKIVSYVYAAGYGNYNDPFMNYGLEKAAGTFADLINSGRTSDAYNLFAPEYGAAVSETQFNSIIDVVRDYTGEFRSLEIVETCSALLYRKKNESVAYGLFRLNGSKDTVYMQTNVSYNNRTFYLYGFDFFSGYELNNPTDVQQAQQRVDQLMRAQAQEEKRAAYALLHDDFRQGLDFDVFEQYLTQAQDIMGPLKKMQVVDRLFCRSGESLADNEYVMVVQAEGEKKTFICLFLFGYDADLQLRISYFYLNQF